MGSLTGYPPSDLLAEVCCRSLSILLKLPNIADFQRAMNWCINWYGWLHDNQQANIETNHYSDVIMGAMVSQITGVSIVYPTVCSGADQRKHQSSESLAFVRAIHRRPLNSPHKWPVTRKMFPFDDVIMTQTQTHPPPWRSIRDATKRFMFILLRATWVARDVWRSGPYESSAESRCCRCDRRVGLQWAVMPW